MTNIDMGLMVYVILILFVAMMVFHYISPFLKRFGHIGIREIHYDLNQKTTKQLKTACHHNRDKEIKYVFIRKDTFARSRKYLYRGHFFTPTLVIFAWKRRLIGFSKLGMAIRDMAMLDTLGTELTIDGNALVNHDRIFMPVPTRRYLERQHPLDEEWFMEPKAVGTKLEEFTVRISRWFTEKGVFDFIFDGFEMFSTKQLNFDLNNMGAENMVRGAEMSPIWRASVQQGDALPTTQASLSGGRKVKEVEE